VRVTMFMPIPRITGTPMVRCGAADVPERHFSAQEVALLWSLDVSTVRRLFQDEPGVLKIGKSGRRDGERDYVTLRIPESVVRRVYREDPFDRLRRSARRCE